MKNKFTLILYFICLSVFAWWTWILTAPNLVLTSWAPYWNWQQWMWNTFYHSRSFISQTYLLLIIALFCLFFNLVRRQQFANFKNFALSLAICCLPLICSFNALSFDVFNYLFNAKMVAVYQADPHQQTALNFTDDDWTRFMHNTNTPAPYGYGWTAISLIPYYLAGGKFTLSWFGVRIFNIILLSLTLLLMSKYQKKLNDKNDWQALALFFFNPLVLIEVLTNMHNDLWMMLPALWSILLITVNTQTNLEKKSSPYTVKNINQILGSAVLLLLSSTIKYATLILIPLWIAIFVLRFKTKISDLLKKWQAYIFDAAAVLMFLPLLTTRSQFFHPWYLLWSLIFIPFVKNKTVRTSLLILSFSSLVRYVPVLQEGGFGSWTLLEQQLITFVPLLIYLIFYLGQNIYALFQKQK